MNAKIAGITRVRAVRELLAQYEDEAEVVDQMRALSGSAADPDGYFFDVKTDDDMFVVSSKELGQIFQQRMARIAKELESYGISVSAEDPVPVASTASLADSGGERP